MGKSVREKESSEESKIHVKEKVRVEKTNSFLLLSEAHATNGKNAFLDSYVSKLSIFISVKDKPCSKLSLVFSKENSRIL